MHFFAQRLAAVEMSNGLEHARLMGGLEEKGRVLQAVALPGVLGAKRPAVQEQFHLLAVGIDPHLAGIAFVGRPRPMPADVEHGVAAPLALVEVIGVLGDPPHVRHAGADNARADRVIRLAVVVEHVPDRAPAIPGYFVDPAEVVFVPVAAHLLAERPAAKDAPAIVGYPSSRLSSTRRGTGIDQTPLRLC